MKIRRRIVVVGVIAAGAVALTYLTWRSREKATAGTGALERALLGAKVPLDQTLRTAGFSRNFADAFAAATTEVMSSGNGNYHIAQRLPALKLRRDVRIAMHTNQRVTPGTNKAVRSAAGFDVHPLYHRVIRFAGGYDRYQTFFISYDALSPETLNALGIQRQVARRVWNILPVVHAQPTAMLGIVVSSVTTTTTDSGGGGETFVHGDTAASGQTQQQTVSENTLRQQELGEWRQRYLDEHYDGSLDEYARQYEEHARQFEESLDGDTRARLQEGERSVSRGEITAEESLRNAQSEIEIGNMLRDGETLAQNEARVALERDAAALQRVGTGMALLQALAEWMQQALDVRDWSRQLDAASDCLDRRARNAGQTERQNIELVRAQLEAARSDLYWNSGARALNSGNSALGSTNPIGAAVSVASSGNNAGLRNLTAESVAAALKAVGNCDPPPCSEAPNGGPPAQGLNHTPVNQQNYTPGPGQPSQSACQERWTGTSIFKLPEGDTITADLSWEYSETNGSHVSYTPKGMLTYKPPAARGGCRVVSVAPLTHQLTTTEGFLTVEPKSLGYTGSGASAWMVTECIQCSYDKTPNCRQNMVGGQWMLGSGEVVESPGKLIIKDEPPFPGGTLTYKFEHTR